MSREAFWCEAEEFAGLMFCGRCDLQGGAVGPKGNGCLPKAKPPIGLAEMREVARAVAEREIGSQHAAVNAEFRKEPYMPALRQAAVLYAMAKLVERVEADKEFLERLRKQG